MISFFSGGMMRSAIAHVMPETVAISKPRSFMRSIVSRVASMPCFSKILESILLIFGLVIISFT